MIPYILTAILLFGFPVEQECVEYVARRHEAFGMIFRVFPERFNIKYDGYIATTCDEVGNEYTLWIKHEKFNVSVVDCKNRSEPKVEHPLDVDDRIWWYVGLPNAPSIVTLCK